MKKQFTIMAIALLLASCALAQFEHGHTGPKAHLRERISMIRMWKLVEFLDLSEEQSMAFFPAMNEHESRMKALHEHERRILDRIETILDEESPNRTALSAAVDSVMTLRDERTASKAEFIDKANAILTIEQKARFLLFDRIFEREINNIIDMGRPDGEGHPGRPSRKPK